jgi:hypothetical protein
MSKKAILLFNRQENDWQVWRNHHPSELGHDETLEIKIGTGYHFAQVTRAYDERQGEYSIVATVTLIEDDFSFHLNQDEVYKVRKIPHRSSQDYGIDFILND